MTNINPIDSHPLASLMEKARKDSFFLGFLLNDFSQRKGFDDNALAEHLRCPLDRLPQLFLCRCPNGEDPTFGQDVRTIAEYAPCDETQLLLALREAVVFAKLSRPEIIKGSQTLLAARDRHENKDQLDGNDESANGTEAP